jgi:hypothetical protein
VKVFIGLLACSFALFGCATRSEVIPGPDGTPHHLISCSYAKSCYQKAAELCAGKYKIVNSSTTTSGGGPNTPVSSDIDMLVKCN